MATMDTNPSVAPLVPAPQQAGVTAFNELCKLFNKLKQAKNSEQKRHGLTLFWEAYKSKDTFPVMRLMVPILDRERAAYGMKEAQYTKAVIEMLNLADKSEDALLLKNWRNIAGTRKTGPAGDFAAAVYQVLKHRCRPDPILTINDVNLLLNELAAADLQEKKFVIKKLLQRATATENMWILKIILKDLKMGMQYESILNHYHPEALEYYNICSNLRQVCEKLVDPSVHIQKEQIKLFCPLKPMLAERFTPQKVIGLLGADEYVAEVKYDGDRVMIHKDGQQVRYFTRTPTETTGHVGPKFTAVVLKHVKADKCIIDGEMLVWDNTVGKRVPFGQLRNYTTAIEKDDGRQIWYMAFDLLLVSNEDTDQTVNIMALPLRERRQRLLKIIDQEANLFEVVQQTKLQSPQDVWNVYDESVEAGEEGLIVKSLESTYLPNERSKGKWYKLKAEYMSGDSDALDLIVLGGYFGRGQHRGGLVGEFLLGVKENTSDDKKPDVFYTVGRVGTGYTVDELRQLQKQLMPHWRSVETNGLPRDLQNLHVEKPHVWIEPHKSICLAVRCGEVIRSDKYSSGYSLRFPRTNKILWDKPWNECLDFKGLQDIFTAGRSRATRKRVAEGMTTDSAAAEAVGKSGKRKQAKVGVPKRVITVPEVFRDTDTRDVQVTCQLLKDMVFCILSEDRDNKKADMERRIVECGGNKVQNVTDDVTHVLAGNRTARVTNQIRAGTHDVLSLQWLADSMELGRLLPLFPRYVMFATKALETQLANVMDKFGDQYDIDCTEKSLVMVLDEVDQQGASHALVSAQTVLDTMDEDDQTDVMTRHDVFRSCVCYVDRYTVLGDLSTAIESSRLHLIELTLKCYGAQIDESITPNTTHVIIDETDTSRLALIRSTLRAYHREQGFWKYCLTQAWVEECANCLYRVEERHYAPDHEEHQQHLKDLPEADDDPMQ